MFIVGDCIEQMKNMENKCFDAIITDPPYGLGIEYDQFDDTKENLKNLIERFFTEASRITSRIIIFPGINNVWLYPPADWIACWFYGTTGSWGKLGYNAWQPILFYGKNNRRYGMDTIKYSKMEKRISGHPCSKPLGLMEEVVKRFTDEGETVLDPFCGTGTTILACVKNNRKGVGIEISQCYIKIAQMRLDEHTS